mgnify:CR=1 FL=1
MAGTTKMFCDRDGQTIELTGYVVPMKKAEFAAKFPGVKGYKYDGFDMQTARGEDGQYYPVTRKITYKAFASKHKCDARCLFAKGRTMNCECACGGKNHGRGDAFACEAA